MDVLIGIVGYTPVIPAYPLGPKLMQRLELAFNGRPGTVIENMTWGPLHVVQRFQDAGAIRPKRLILVGASAVCRSPGRVQAFSWQGGTLPDSVMQERIYEAVTGIVDIENTLAIGSHFGVWPAETFTVEIDLAANVFGSMVIADSADRTGDAQLAAEFGFSSFAVIETLAATVIDLAASGADAGVRIAPKSAASLAKVDQFTKHEFVDLSAAPSRQN